MASNESLRADIAQAPGGDPHAVMRELEDAADALKERREAWALECATRKSR